MQEILGRKIAFKQNVISGASIKYFLILRTLIINYCLKTVPNSSITNISYAKLKYTCRVKCVLKTRLATRTKFVHLQLQICTLSIENLHIFNLALN